MVFSRMPVLQPQAPLVHRRHHALPTWVSLALYCSSGPSSNCHLLREIWLLCNPNRPPLFLLSTSLCIRFKRLYIISSTYFLFYLFSAYYLLNLTLLGLMRWGSAFSTCYFCTLSNAKTSHCCYSWTSCTVVGCLLEGRDAVSYLEVRPLASLLCSFSHLMSL